MRLCFHTVTVTACVLYPRTSLPTLISLSALQINFASEQSGGATETEGVKKLRQICAELPGTAGAVKDLLAALQDDSSEKISTYEFLSSGAVQGLRAYLQGRGIRALHGHMAVALPFVPVLGRVPHICWHNSIVVEGCCQSALVPATL